MSIVALGPESAARQFWPMNPLTAIIVTDKTTHRTTLLFDMAITVSGKPMRYKPSAIVFRSDPGHRNSPTPLNERVGFTYSNQPSSHLPTKKPTPGQSTGPVFLPAEILHRGVVVCLKWWSVAARHLCIPF